MYASNFAHPHFQDPFVYPKILFAFVAPLCVPLLGFVRCSTPPFSSVLFFILSIRIHTPPASFIFCCSILPFAFFFVRFGTPTCAFHVFLFCTLPLSIPILSVCSVTRFFLVCSDPTFNAKLTKWSRQRQRDTRIHWGRQATAQMPPMKNEPRWGMKLVSNITLKKNEPSWGNPREIKDTAGN